MITTSPTSTLFPYTTLFRSLSCRDKQVEARLSHYSHYSHEHLSWRSVFSLRNLCPGDPRGTRMLSGNRQRFAHHESYGFIGRAPGVTDRQTLGARSAHDLNGLICPCDETGGNTRGRKLS